MSDETHSTGMGAFEGYALGRLSARNQQVLGDAAEAVGRRFFRPAAPAVDVNALLSENEMLRRELAATQASFNILQGNHTRLKAWATQASQALDEHGLLER